MTTLADLTHEEKLQLAKELRSAEAAEKEAQRQREAAEWDRWRVELRINSAARRRERLAAELKKRDETCAPYEEWLQEPEPDKADLFAHSRWRDLQNSARENLEVHERRRKHLRHCIADIDQKLEELRAQLD